MMKQADYAGLKKTLAALAFEADKSDQDLSLPLASILARYSLSELVHKLLEGKTT